VTALTLATVTLVVPDYDDGIAYYRDTLGFTLFEDTDMGGGKRWVVVGPDRGARLLLAKAKGDAQVGAIGNQTGGRVAFFLETDDFAGTYDRFARAGVNFLESPREETYGKVVVFSDPFGNRWDLIEPEEAR
jgi:catechol 2,3-dioxygenase-like lactoylglutathione lyase family enzyme